LLLLLAYPSSSYADPNRFPCICIEREKKKKKNEK
jgi:hypothetical protein